MALPRSRLIRSARRGACLLLLTASGACALLGRREPEIDRSEDPRIRQEVEALLARQPALQGEAIRVEVEGRVVMLHGIARGIGAWQCATAAAELVEGVQTVVNQLVLERGPRDVRCLVQPAAPG